MQEYRNENLLLCETSEKTQKNYTKIISNRKPLETNQNEKKCERETMVLKSIFIIHLQRGKKTDIF